MNVAEPMKPLPVPVVPSPLVAIVIVGYRNPDDIRACLTALQKSSETNFIILVCENGGRDAFVNLILEIQALVEPSSEIPEIVDERVTQGVGRPPTARGSDGSRLLGPGKPRFCWRRERRFETTGAEPELVGDLASEPRYGTNTRRPQSSDRSRESRRIRRSGQSPRLEIDA